MRSPRAHLRSRIGLAAACGALAVAVAVTHASARAQSVPAGSIEAAFPELGLKLSVPALSDLEPQGELPDRVKARWAGDLGPSRVAIELFVLPLSDHDYSEPEDVLDDAIERARDPKQGGKADFEFDRVALHAGAVGYAPYTASVHGVLREHGSTEEFHADIVLLAGLLKDAGYVVRIAAKSPLVADALIRVDEFLAKGVAYTGEVRDGRWTDEEAKARWTQDAPPKTHKKFEKPVRTEHYIILTSSSSGVSFAKKMEECYATIRKTYPFDEVPGRRLMPVLLFRTPDEYYDFFAAKSGIPREQAERSKGVASGDFYATWYEAPNDPVHIHEATHQIFKLRLRLWGGGSWFQEGVAEYIETRDNERGNAARAVKKREHMPIEQFVTIPSLLMSTPEGIKGGDDAGNLYKQAALLIEFLRESKWGKDRFQDFLHAVGSVRPNDRVAIERAVKRVYGTDLKGLEDQWVEYCKKR